MQKAKNRRERKLLKIHLYLRAFSQNIAILIIRIQVENNTVYFIRIRNRRGKRVLDSFLLRVLLLGFTAKLPLFNLQIIFFTIRQLQLYLSENSLLNNFFAFLSTFCLEIDLNTVGGCKRNSCTGNRDK